MGTLDWNHFEVVELEVVHGDTNDKKNGLGKHW